MNKQQLANKIWESANRMRSKIEANEYKDYILGFIFYKFLSDKEVAFLKKDGYEDADIQEYAHENNEQLVDYCQQHLGYFIAYDNLFSTWLAKGNSFTVDNVRTALSAFNRLISETQKKVFSKIFNTLETGLSKLGDSTSNQTKAISELIQLIKDIPTDGKQDYDVLGFIYEYLISNFAANAGKKAGEFYTPHEVSQLMSEIVANHLKARDKIEIYDPTSGSGSLLITIGKSVSKYMKSKDDIMYYAQELKENTYNLTRMNLVMRGIKPDNIFTRCGDTLEQDWPMYDDATQTYNPLYLDAVVSNPPYSQRWDPKHKETDPRYRYGIAPKGKADYAFLLHDLYHIKPSGIMTIVLPHGVLFRGDALGGADGLRHGTLSGCQRSLPLGHPGLHESGRRSLYRAVLQEHARPLCGHGLQQVGDDLLHGGGHDFGRHGTGKGEALGPRVFPLAFHAAAPTVSQRRRVHRQPAHPHCAPLSSYGLRIEVEPGGAQLGLPLSRLPVFRRGRMSE